MVSQERAAMREIRTGDEVLTIEKTVGELWITVNSAHGNPTYDGNIAQMRIEMVDLKIGDDVTFEDSSIFTVQMKSDRGCRYV